MFVALSERFYVAISPEGHQHDKFLIVMCFSVLYCYCGGTVDGLGTGLACDLCTPMNRQKGHLQFKLLRLRIPEVSHPCA